MQGVPPRINLYVATKAPPEPSATSFVKGAPCQFPELEEQNRIDDEAYLWRKIVGNSREETLCCWLCVASLELPRETTSGEGRDGLNLGMISREQRRMLWIVMDGSGASMMMRCVRA